MRIFVATPGHLRTAPMGFYCAETFKSLGHEVRLFDAGSLTLSEKVFLRPIAKLRKQHRFEKQRLNQRLLQEIKSFSPDLFLSIFGFDLFPETLEIIRKLGVRTACWWLNDPFQFERGLSIARAYDYFFTNCKKSTERYLQSGISKTDYLPHAAFTPFHKPVSLTKAEEEKWKSEVCFVGDWGPVRQGILSMLSQKIDLKIWGPWRKHLTRKDRLWSRVVDGYFTTEMMVKAFCATKVAINLHSWFGYYPYGLNPRTFEIPGSGALEICDSKEELSNHFKIGSEIITYENGLELESKLKELIDDDSARRQIAKAGLERIQLEHTYVHRMKQLLEKIS